jgi:glycosyltransferase involved in cell wall biosynthesis
VKEQLNARPLVAIVANNAWNLYNFRGNLIRSLLNAGYSVLTITPSGEYCEKLQAMGCEHAPILMDNKGTNPLRDARLLMELLLLLRGRQPDLLMAFTVKPNVYASIAARAHGIPVINSIEGLGTAFVAENWLMKVVCGLYRFALSGSKKVIFLNEEDRQLFLERRLVNADKTLRIPGLGVDLQRFQPSPLPEGPVTFLLTGRMLWDKGVGEFVAAARLVLDRHPHVKFQLLGFLDVENPTAINRSQMDAWVEEGVVTYLGTTDRVADVIAQSTCIVLPSYYREGVPRSLMEAAAMSRPIITTDWVGCKEVVSDGDTGYLCLPKNHDDLAQKMLKIINMPKEGLAAMGARGRKKMELEFDERQVIETYSRTILKCIGASKLEQK